MKKLWLVFWRMGVVYFFYPVMIGIMIYITYKGYHWGFGALVIAVILVLDPTWGRLSRNALRMWKNR